MGKIVLFFLGIVILLALGSYYFLASNRPVVHEAVQDSSQAPVRTDTNVRPVDTTASLPPSAAVDTKNIAPQDVVAFAVTQLGIPYKYGSADPKYGFDCSGFITYVFNHFGISVPRSSVEFTNVGTEVQLPQAKQGDLILFTGTDSTEHQVGHMGIVISSLDSLRFIHSSSGKAMGVTISALDTYYRTRFVKLVRVFK